MLNPYIEQSLLNRQYIECVMCNIVKKSPLYIHYTEGLSFTCLYCSRFTGYGDGDEYGIARGNGYGDGGGRLDDANDKSTY